MSNPLAVTVLLAALAAPSGLERVPFKIPDYASDERIAGYATPAELDVAGSLGSVDTARMFMYGESRGGMMTLQAIRDGYPLRAAAVYGAFTDFAALLEATPRFREAASQLWPEYPAKLDEISRRRSALSWAEKLTVPLLIVHGGQDRDVPPAQSLALAAKLQELGKPYVRTS